MAKEKGRRFLGELKGEFCVKKFGLYHEEPSLFVGAQCVKPQIYLLWSGFWALFFTSMQMVGIYYNENSGAQFLLYLTNISYMLQNATVLVDFTVAIYVYWKRPDVTDGKSVKMTWYFKALWVMFTTSNTGSIVVTGMYYGLLTPGFRHDSVNKHLLNGVYSIVNILFCAKPVYILHVYQPMIFAVLYTILSVIHQLAGGDPIYDALDWSETGRSIILTVLVVFVACPVIHVFIFYSLFTVRLFVASHCCRSRVETEPEVTARKFTIYTGDEVGEVVREDIKGGDECDKGGFYRSKSAHDETMLRY